ncbi:MAG: TRAP transporter small permease [Candidatus Rokubacteria bacterium]|nr:TRAP transporter small permease [Candidatus Rokubacteria bacterium]
MPPPRPAGLEALVQRTSKAASLLGGVATLAITALITFDVLMRYFFDEPQLFVDELASFLQVLVVFWGLAYTFRVGGHVRVDLVTAHLPRPVRAWLRVVTLVLGIVLLLALSWVTWLSVGEAWEQGRVSTVMLYPIWLPMALIPTGLLLMALAMLGPLARQVRAALGRGVQSDEVGTDTEPAG